MLDLYPGVQQRIIIGNQAVEGHTVPLNTNSYVAITYDGTTGIAYLNGQNVASVVHGEFFSWFLIYFFVIIIFDEKLQSTFTELLP